MLPILTHTKRFGGPTLAAFMTFALAALCFSAAPSDVSAQTAQQQEARALYDAGRLAFESGRYPDALSRFEASFEISPLPGTLYSIGVSADQANRRQRAVSAYQDYLRRFPNGRRRGFIVNRLRELGVAAAPTVPSRGTDTAARQARTTTATTTVMSQLPVASQRARVAVQRTPVNTQVRVGRPVTANVRPDPVRTYQPPASGQPFGLVEIMRGEGDDWASAEVLIDGARFVPPATGVIRVPVRPGQHTLAISRPQHRDFTHSFTVTSGQRLRMHPSLEPLRGRAESTTPAANGPRTVRVYIHGHGGSTNAIENRALRELSSTVASETQGMVRVEHRGTDSNAAASIQSGDVAIAILPARLMRWVSPLGRAVAAPGILSGVREFQTRFPAVRQLIEEDAEGIRVLGARATRARFLFSRERVRSVPQLNGISVGTDDDPFTVAFLRSIGARPLVDIRTAGTTRGEMAIHHLDFAWMEQKEFRYAKAAGWDASFLVVNDRALAELPPARRTILLREATRRFNELTSQQHQADRDLEQRLMSGGLRVDRTLWRNPWREAAFTAAGRLGEAAKRVACALGHRAACS